MLHLTLEKLKARVPEIINAAVRATLPIDGVSTYALTGPAAKTAMAEPPSPEDVGWRPLLPRERWGAEPGSDPYAPPELLPWGIPVSSGSNHWLRATLRIPEAWRGKPVLIRMDWEGIGAGGSIEAIAYLDGQVLAGLDEFHHAVQLPQAAHDGSHQLLIRCFVPRPKDFEGLHLQLRDETIFRLGHRMRALVEALETFQDSDMARHAALQRLNAAYNALDLREGWQSTRFAASAQAALAIMEADSPEQPPLSTRTPTIIATGHAHLDVAWLWPLWRTRQKVAHTVANVLHLMERYPDFYFSMSQPQVYAYLKQDDPALYKRMRERIEEGRFEPVGIMWLETDCNLPTGESLARHLLHGARFFADEFGIENHIVWLPDVFGYSAALPQLLRSCGISCFMTTKISWNQFNRMPFDTFRWRGIDGTEVLAHFVTATDNPVRHPAAPQFYTYNGHMTAGEVFGTWNHYRQKDINDELLYIYGWGDGGGGPTEEMLEATHIFRRLDGFPQLRQGRVDQFFERLYRRVWDNPQLPVWSGELYLEYHRGTYTSQSRTKQANRAAELLYRETEWLNAWAATLGAPDRQEMLNEGWKLILLNQFHDIIPGSSIPQVYIDSNAQYAEVQRIGQEVRAAALEHITGQLVGRTPDKTTAGSNQSSILVFNSLPWDRRDIVRIELAAGGVHPTLLDTYGNQLITQIVEEQAGERTLLVEVDVPSYGYTQVGRNISQSANHTTSADRGASPLVVRRSSMENGELRLELDDNGEIASLYDLHYSREVVARGATVNRLILYEDRPLDWQAWDIDIFYEEKPYPVQAIHDWQVVEEGPLRSVVALTRKVGSSTIRQRICMWRGSRRIDFVTEVDWQERQQLLRALFPLDINATRATCEIQFGAVERPTHRNTSWDWARFEVCAHRWVDLSEGEYGVALLNNGKYGHSLHHNVLGISLLRGATIPDPEADRGYHRFTYSLFPHAGDWRSAAVVRRAYELNAPLSAHRTQTTTIAASPTASFLSVPTDHIVVETVKAAEDGNGLIVRLYEAHNQRGPAALIFGCPVVRASEVDILERDIAPAEVAGSEVRFQIRPFEVKTFRVQLR